MILARLPEVERRYLRHQTTRAIATAVGVAEVTIRRDIERVQQLQRERIAVQSDQLRAQIIAELDDTIQLAEDAYTWDKQAEAAVLYGLPAEGPDGQQLRVHYDDDGRAQFRGGKAQALNVRRQAIMDKAKVLGVVVDKQALTDSQGKDLSFVEIARQLHGLESHPDA